MTCAQIMKRPAFANLGEQMAWEIEHHQTPHELSIILPEQAWHDLADTMSELTRVRTHSQNMTTAARAQAEMKMSAHLS